MTSVMEVRVTQVLHWNLYLIWSALLNCFTWPFAAIVFPGLKGSIQIEGPEGVTQSRSVSTISRSVFGRHSMTSAVDASRVASQPLPQTLSPLMEESEMERVCARQICTPVTLPVVLGKKVRN